MKLRHILSNNFKIGSIEEYFSVQEIVSLNLTVKTNVGLKRGGQMNLHVITEAILI